MEVSILSDVEWDPQLDYDRHQIGIILKKEFMCGYCRTFRKETKIGHYHCPKCKQVTYGEIE